jgi:diguanylate cyclase (GGDEF)-like protein
MLRFMWGKVLILIIMFFSLNISDALADDQVRNVLFISSYNENFETVPYQIDGIKSVLLKKNFHLDVEYMDSKRFSDEKSREVFYDLLKYKMSNLAPYDAIIVGDDSALQFAMDFQDDLFKETPIVFLGINNFQRAGLADENKYMTGIIEETSLKENVEIAQKFNSKATRVVAIVDNTLTGKGDMEQFYSIEDEFNELSFEHINSSEYTFEELGNVLENVENDTILLYLSMFEDKAGRNITIDEAVEVLREHTKVPVYRASIGGVGKGLLGGMMVSYFDSGEIAAEMVMKILNGSPVESVKMVTESPNRYIFDYNIIKKYNIDEKLIPEGSLLINNKNDIFEQYWEYILITLLVIVFLVVLLMVLTYDAIKQRKIEKELMESHEKLDKIAHYDFLTNLPNRIKFKECLINETEEGNSGAVIMVGIDNFKKINNTLGHEYGNMILKKISDRLSKIADENHFVSRLGGDEFLILVRNESKQELFRCINFIKNLFQEGFVIENKENHIKASIGVALFPDDGIEAEKIIANADTAMYKAKSSGKSNCLFYTSQMKEELLTRNNIETVLREALKNDGFKLVYQPYMSSLTGEAAGYEALLRLRNHNIPPNEFIPVAEECGLIINIGRYVTYEAVSQLKKWKEQGYELKPISLNFSCKQLKDTQYVECLKKILRDNDIEPEYIEIEITESILLEKAESTMDFLYNLKNMGIKIALDDFGTGFSSLNYLTYIPMNKVKLDKSLIDKFFELNNLSAVENIISLAHSMKFQITAEGIEELRQYESLRSIECDYFQGYYFSRPLEASEIEKKYFNKQE